MKNSKLSAQNLQCLKQLQSRLKKSKYFNRDAVPGCLDAQIFKALQKSNKFGIPSSKESPNLYYWFILINQFSMSTLQKWISRNSQLDEQDKNLVQNLKKAMDNCQIYNENSPTIDGGRNNSPDNEKSSKFHNQFLIKINRIQKIDKQQENESSSENEYIMDIKINEQIASSPQSIKLKLLQKDTISNFRIDLSKFEVIESGAFRIHFKSDCYNCQSLKDSISKWPEVQNIQVRKDKKHISLKNKDNEK